MLVSPISAVEATTVRANAEANRSPVVAIGRVVAACWVEECVTAESKEKLFKVVVLGLARN
jgi:hypothetical protein